ncbi:MAG TPA: hypothetical protein VGD46_10090, partial [Rhizobacter sp.]
MDGRRQHGAFRWAVPVAAGAVGVLLWWSPWRPLPSETPDVRPLAAPVAAAPASLPYVRPPVLQHRPAVKRPAPLRRVGVAEVCGFGEVQLPPDDPDPVQRIPAELRRTALDAMDRLMLASDDEQVRAAAL